MKLFSVLKGAAVSVFCVVAILGASQMVGAQTIRGNDRNYQKQQDRSNRWQGNRDGRDNNRYDRNRHDRDNDRDNRNWHHDRRNDDYRKYNNGASWHKHETTFKKVRNGHRY